MTTELEALTTLYKLTHQGVLELSGIVMKQAEIMNMQSQALTKHKERIEELFEAVRKMQTTVNMLVTEYNRDKKAEDVIDIITGKQKYKM